MANKRISLFFVVFLCVFSTSDLFAQKGVRVGFTFAPNISRPNLLDILPEDFGRKYAAGVAGGVLAQYGLNSGIALHTGFLMSSKSYTVVNYDNPLRDRIRGNVVSFEIPLGFYLRQPLSRQSFVRELVGISAVYNQNRDETAFFRYPEENPFALEAVINQRLSYTLNIGVEFMRELESGHIFTAGIVFKRGLGNPMTLNVINDAQSTAPAFEMGYSGSYLGLNFGFLFSLKDLKPVKGDLYFE